MGKPDVNTNSEKAGGGTGNCHEFVQRKAKPGAFAAARPIRLHLGSLLTMLSGHD